MYANDKIHPAASEDQRWFGSLSSRELETHLHERGTVHLDSLPVGASLTINARSFPTALLTVRALSKVSLNLVTLATPSPCAPLGIFFRASKQEPTYLEYDDGTVKLQLTDGKGLTFPENIGERGVAGLSLPAEEQWDTATSRIDESCLRSAGLCLEKTIVRNDIAQPADLTPSFRPLPTFDETFRNKPSAELTAWYLDRTLYVRKLVEHHFQQDFANLLGEFQLSFVCFAFIGCLNSLDHWARLLRDLCNSVSLDKHFPNVVVTLADTLRAQFGMLDVDATQFAIGGALRACLVRFISTEWDEPRVQRFAETLNNLMGWRLSGDDDGDDSDGPVIVDC